MQACEDVGFTIERRSLIEREREREIDRGQPVSVREKRRVGE